jgi:hypothetical protein
MSDFSIAVAGRFKLADAAAAAECTLEDEADESVADEHEEDGEEDIIFLLAGKAGFEGSEALAKNSATDLVLNTDMDEATGTGSPASSHSILCKS